MSTLRVETVEVNTIRNFAGTTLLNQLKSGPHTDLMSYASNYIHTYGVNSGQISYVYPPSGFSMTNLKQFISSSREIYFSGGVDGNDSLYNYYTVRSGDIECVVYNSEQRASPACNWTGSWGK